MAWQLHYTSARSGPTGRGGFQFVAETPGLPPETQAAVAPSLTYRPPPEAPLSPGQEELAAFPVAFSYDLLDGRPLLVRTRYLGRDYSGRYGNFLAHAVVAEPAELEGLRPAELWESALWADAPGDGELTGPVDLTPGPESDPEALGEWLAASGEAAYELLARLVGAVAGVLARGHGRVVLISDEAVAVARWIAVVSYSLPLAVTSRLSFVTYSADPDAAHHRVVGTTPGAWAAAHRDAAAAAIDVRPGPFPPAGPPPGRFARTVAGCWRDGDLAGLDALGELALVDPDTALDAALDRAAALLALCRDDPELTGAEEAAAARLLARHGAALPDWVWYNLLPGLPRMGFDLALAIWAWARRTGDTEAADRCGARCAALGLTDTRLRAQARERVPRLELSPAVPARLRPVAVEALHAAADLTEVAEIGALAAEIGVAVPAGEIRSAAAGRARAGAADLPAALAALPGSGTWTGELVAGAVAGLAAADEETLERVLTDAACDALDARPGVDWAAAPAVARRVLGSVGRRRDRRPAVTETLLRLDRVSQVPGDAETGRVLRAVWRAAPSVAECTAVLAACGAGLARHGCLAELPSRAFARLTGPELAAPGTLRLAEQVRAALDGRPSGEDPAVAAARDAAAVLAGAAALDDPRPDRVARELGTLSGVSPDLAESLWTAVARALAARTARFQAELLAAADPPVRARLTRYWLRDRPGRGLGGRGAAAERRNQLVEVALRLRLLGASDPRLVDWARDTAAGRLTYRQLDAHLRDLPELRGALRELAAERRES
ncbi:hypothetical protein DPM19_29480 [Actinomadura craniellae]|uniref:Uncharacterized protein n=1 Tax=Actinomadura craniellae TaxID=2231787 RepID=A0A365GY22_9ACTN|nr:hypothetical protein [Actinomadura craniellae]RAY11744.1 hypothetical protein DPM19_29480 [Actinomadura craniellae]